MSAKSLVCQCYNIFVTISKASCITAYSIVLILRYNNVASKMLHGKVLLMKFKRP